MSTIKKLSRRAGSVLAIGALVTAMGGTWITSSTATAAPTTAAAATATAAGSTGGRGDDAAHAAHPARGGHKELSGKLNLNTATEEQLQLLPTVGPSKAERVIAWRKKNGGFKRIADLRRVKGFGYRTLKKLEPFLDIKGDTTLAPK